MSLEHAGVRVLRRKDVLDRFKISRTTLNNWIEAGDFPRPISLGPNTRAWLEDEIDAVIRERARARDCATP